MKWPNESDERKKYIAALLAQHLGELQLSAKDLPDPAEAGDWFDCIDAVQMLAGISQVAVPRTLFAEILGLIDQLRPKPAPT